MLLMLLLMLPATRVMRRAETTSLSVSSCAANLPPVESLMIDLSPMRCN